MAIDIAEERKLFEAIIASMPVQAREQLSADFERLAAIHGDPAVTDKAQVETDIRNLLQRAALASCQPAKNLTGLYILIGVVIGMFFIGLFAYFAALGPDKYVLIETTRPVLVFTLIIAMLGFGGALIFTALFKGEAIADFEKRFRLGREVFLVYSGIFGTIIGFYFGAASGEAANADPPSLTAVSVQADGMLTAQVEGGSAPYAGTIRLDGDDDDRSLVVSGSDLSIQLNPAQDCPASAQITVRDADSQSAELTVPDSASDLFDQGQGWTGCADEAAAEAAEGETVDNATGNAANGG